MSVHPALDAPCITATEGEAPSVKLGLEVSFKGWCVIGVYKGDLLCTKSKKVVFGYVISSWKIDLNSFFFHITQFYSLRRDYICPSTTSKGRFYNTRAYKSLLLTDKIVKSTNHSVLKRLCCKMPLNSRTTKLRSLPWYLGVRTWCYHSYYQRSSWCTWRCPGQGLN